MPVIVELRKARIFHKSIMDIKVDAGSGQILAMDRNTDDRNHEDHDNEDLDNDRDHED